MAATLDEIFDGDAWRGWAEQDDADARAEHTIRGFREMTGALWATYIRMLGSNNATRYMLLHLTNHHAGRDLMKDCMWKVCPDGGFRARKSDDPRQEYLIKPEPDLAPLRRWVLERLPIRWQKLEQELRATVWQAKHLNSIVRKLRRQNVIEARDFAGRFSRSANPELYIPEHN